MKTVHKRVTVNAKGKPVAVATTKAVATMRARSSLY